MRAGPTQWVRGEVSGAGPNHSLLVLGSGSSEWLLHLSAIFG